MLIALCSLLFILNLLGISSAFAETGPLGWGKPGFHSELTSDRPDFTESVDVIDSGHIQGEFGYTFQSDREDGKYVRDHTLPEALIRIGVVDDFEFRFSWVGYSLTRESGATSETAEDLGLGVKHRLLNEDGAIPDVSVIGAIQTPSEELEVSDKTLVPEIKLLWGYEFDLIPISLSGNLNVSRPTNDSESIEERYTLISQSIAVGTDVTDIVGMYVEYFGINPLHNQEDADQHFVDGGFTFAVNPDLQFDVRAGFGLNDASSDVFAGVGVVVRL